MFYEMRSRLVAWGCLQADDVHACVMIACADEVIEVRLFGIWHSTCCADRLHIHYRANIALLRLALHTIESKSIVCLSVQL